MSAGPDTPASAGPVASVYDATPCFLGEGALWHPERRQLFWFDVIGKTLHTREGETLKSWTFAGPVSAAGWTGRDALIVATDDALLTLDLATGAQERLCPLEADQPGNRSNDGRADPQGGFWISTMGRKAEDRAGAIYRYYRGELRLLFDKVTIPNATCFTPDGGHACFSDTARGRVMRVALDAEGWPKAAPELFLDLAPQKLSPDGAVIDAEGVFWSAQWGTGRVAAYAPDGRFLRAVEIGAPNTSCPAFGGEDLSTLFCTTARQGLSEEGLREHPLSGSTFSAPGVARGQAEHRVIL